MNFRRHIEELLGGRWKSKAKSCQQAAAVCCRLAAHGELELLLVTSRDTCRWILPKGNTEHKEAAYRAAQREAFEEAGIEGKVCKKPIGFYSYLKDGERELCVSVHLLRVTKNAAHFQEEGQRHLAWFRPSVGATLVDEPELGELLASLTALEVRTSQDKSLSKKLALKLPVLATASSGA
ncbi:NUDIX hydrolase [Rhizobium sp. CG4]|uniref:NUDIX hydrolase n=1 Tax=Rhizobium sp. CG4 TaxID=2726075 RepID=UPI0020344A98|nr:NUDIX hydrolase [Rhizobium sp. CG4]MCM2458859.1 NUDIX hydrolase [Rhizobium sp. CG4]